MPDVAIATSDSVCILTLDRPPANALNASLVDDLAAAFAQAERNPDVRGILITSGVEGYFSAGFDVHEVFDYDRATMTAYWRAFVELYERIYASEKPVVAGMPGHTFAGGVLLALACDARVMADGPYGVGVSAINLGVPLPLGAMNMAINAMGPGHARRLFLTGDTVDPHRALAMGFVQQVVAADRLYDAALARTSELAGKSQPAFHAIHAMFDSLSGRDELGSDTERVDAFIDFWFSDEAELYKQYTRDRLGKVK